MTEFNLSKIQRSDADWLAIASEANEESNTQLLVSAGILGGMAIAAITSSPLVGAIPIVWGFVAAWNAANRQSKNDEAIEQGCVAHLLPERRFHLYLKQYGEPAVHQQLTWAEEEGYPMSAIAQSFLKYRQSQEQPQLPETKNSSQPQPAQAPMATYTNTNNLAKAMAQRLTSRIVCAAPRTGKGMLITTSLKYLKAARPDVELWAIDIKADPGEDVYYSIFERDRLLRIDLMGFNVPKGAHDQICAFFQRFNQSTAETKLIWLNEGVTFAAKMPDTWKLIRDFLVGLCSAGATGSDGQTGRFALIDTQSPNVSDFGLKTNASRNVFRRVFLVNDDRSLLNSAVSSGFVSRFDEAEFNALQTPDSKVYAYDSLSDKWLALPRYSVEFLSENAATSDVRKQLEALLPKDGNSFPTSGKPAEAAEAGKSASQKLEASEVASEVELPGSDDFRKYFPEAPEAAEKSVFQSYQKFVQEGGSKKEFITQILDAGTGGRKYQAAVSYISYLCQKYGS